jgi:hypothetical protein
MPSRFHVIPGAHNMSQSMHLSKLFLGCLLATCLTDSVVSFSVSSPSLKLLRSQPVQFRNNQLTAQTKTRITRSNLPRMQSRGGEDDVPPLERFIACLPYALPLSDAFEWGHFLFDKFPLLSIPFIPLFPVISFLNAPFVSFGVFIVLFSFVTRNPSFSRFIRFNTLQVRFCMNNAQIFSE